MKREFLLALVSAFIPWSAILAEETPLPELAQATRILGSVADGTPPPPSPKPVVPDFKIESSLVRQLPDRKITIHRVEDPRLPPLPGPPARQKPDLEDSKVPTWTPLRELRESTRNVMLSATVYDHKRTFLRWSVAWNGARSEEFQAWSNVDFNHLSGFGTYEHNGLKYTLMMSVGNTDTKARQRILEARGMTFEEPKYPDLPKDSPAFVIAEGDTTNHDGMAVIEGLHELYRIEKNRLSAAYEGRERARIEQEAYLKAHPPEPEDVVIHFWRGSRTEESR